MLAKEPKQDPKSRKWLLTINNPIEKGWDHSKIKNELTQFKSLSYYCLGDEQGDTYHTHLFIMSEIPIRFSTIKKKFPEAHIDKAYGKAEENKDYIQKAGKWADTEKAETTIPDTFEESGELPEEPGQTLRFLEALLLILSSQHHKGVFIDCSTVLVLIELDSYSFQFLHTATQFADLVPDAGQPALIIVSDFAFQTVYDCTLIQRHGLGLLPDFCQNNFGQRQFINRVRGTDTPA